MPEQKDLRLLTDFMRDPRDTFRVGAWFSVPEESVLKRSGEPFAPVKAEEGRGGRRVVQGTSYGPNMVFFPRSASSRSGYDHEAHDHRSDYEGCQIDQDGRVPRVPVTVKAPDVTYDSWSCIEPDASRLYAEIERWLRP